MKKLFLAVALALLPSLAFATDNLAVKAINNALTAPTASCTAAGCSGFFVGAEISGSGTGVNVLNLGSLNAAGTFMGANAGYQFYNGTYWLGVKASVDYEVGSSTSQLTPGLSNVFAFEGVEVGGNLASLFSIPAITLPGPLSSAVPTVLIGACQHGDLTGYCAGAAAHFFIPNSKFTVDVNYLNAQYGPSKVAPNATVSTENRGTFGFSYHF